MGGRRHSQAECHLPACKGSEVARSAEERAELRGRPWFHLRRRYLFGRRRHGLCLGAYQRKPSADDTANMQ
jgi:hypothetical protein